MAVLTYNEYQFKILINLTWYFTYHQIQNCFN